MGVRLLQVSCENRDSVCWRHGDGAVLSFTCGSLRGVCMEARAVTAGLPALVAEEGLLVGPGLSVSFTYRGVGSRAQAVGTMGPGDFGFVAGRLTFGQSNQTFSKSRLETNLQHADRPGG